jgi:hypothetical protein
MLNTVRSSKHCIRETSITNTLLNLEDEAWESKCKREGTVCSKLFSSVEEAQVRTRYHWITLSCFLHFL